MTALPNLVLWLLDCRHSHQASTELQSKNLRKKANMMVPLKGNTYTEMVWDAGFGKAPLLPPPEACVLFAYSFHLYIARSADASRRLGSDTLAYTSTNTVIAQRCCPTQLTLTS